MIGIKILELLPFVITSLATAIATLRGHQVYLRKRDALYPKCPTCTQSIRPIRGDEVCGVCGYTRDEHAEAIKRTKFVHNFKRIPL
jgi:hypothetical protein